MTYIINMLCNNVHGAGSYWKADSHSTDEKIPHIYRIQMSLWCLQNPTTGLYPEPSALFLKIHWNVILHSSGSQSVPCRSRGIHDQFPRDPWIHFCNGNIEV